MDILSNRCRKNLLSSPMPAVCPYLQAELAGQSTPLYAVPEGTLTRVEKKAGENGVGCGCAHPMVTADGNADRAEIFDR